MKFFTAYGDVCVIADDTLAFKYPRAGRGFPAMPLIKKQNVDLRNVRYTGFQNTRERDGPDAKEKTIGFFLNDSRIEYVVKKPWRYAAKLAQYKQVLSPDLGCNAGTALEEQWMNVFLSRLAGAYWQRRGLTVIPSVSWSGGESFAFCSDGVEKGSVIAVSTLGTRAIKERFMAGFIEVCRKIEPSCVICYDTPYPEMYGCAPILPLEHEGNRARRLLRYRPFPGQLVFPFYQEKIYKEGA